LIQRKSSLSVIVKKRVFEDGTFLDIFRRNKMKINILPKLDTKQPVLVLGLYEEDTHNYKSFNKVLELQLKDAIKEKRFSKKFGQVFATSIQTIAHKKIFVYGLGKKKEFTLERLRRVLGKAVNAVKGSHFSGFTTNIPELCKDLGEEAMGRATAEGILLANYKFIKYFDKETQEKKKALTSVSLRWEKKANGFDTGLKRGTIIAETSDHVRDLVNDTAGVVNSTYMEKVARKVASEHPKLSVKVLNKPQLEKLGMGALLGVNAGSENPPKLIFVEYKGGGNGKWTSFVGKGITFDSGGYNLKPSRYIEDMKIDMGGSAAALGAVRCAALLGVKKNVVAVMAMCENMVSGHAQHPGDIVKAYNGKWIEIGNTDAEGRLVLADALAYTQDTYKPEVMIDMATLTGACVVALGYYAAAVVGKDEGLNAQLKASGEASGDRCWPLPFYEEYHDAMDGAISDLNNISTKGKGYEGGTISAGVFLSKFVDTNKTKWAHLDIAGSAYWEVKGDYFHKGATGSGVRVLSYYLLDN
jgi:leucyl aminopeptidase